MTEIKFVYTVELMDGDYSDIVMDQFDTEAEAMAKRNELIAEQKRIWGDDPDNDINETYAVFKVYRERLT